MAVKRRWHLDGEGRPVKHTRAWARQFAYDDPRAGYMNRNIDVSASSREPFDPSLWRPIAPAAWTDYDGVMPYGDFGLDVAARSRLRERRRGEPCNGVITEKARYADGFGTFGRQLLDAQGQATETRYLHGDLIRSTNLTTDQGRTALSAVASDQGGTAVSAAACTAFGELVGDDGQGGTRIGADPPTGFPRYQYAGGWGYEADLLTLGGSPTGPLPPIRLLHVGARWYQPDIGRFVMRDPVGLQGSLNFYGYVNNVPAFAIDPSGLMPRWFYEFEIWITGGQDSWLDDWSDEYINTASAIAGGVGVAAAAGAGALAWAGVDYGCIVAMHWAHHYFPDLGRKVQHIEVIVYRVGRSMSHHKWRMPLY